MEKRLAPKRKTSTCIDIKMANIMKERIWAYKKSELIGENILAYDPVPGIQKGCISLDEATDGKAWSL